MKQIFKVVIFVCLLFMFAGCDNNTHTSDIKTTPSLSSEEIKSIKNSVMDELFEYMDSKTIAPTNVIRSNKFICAGIIYENINLINQNTDIVKLINDTKSKIDDILLTIDVFNHLSDDNAKFDEITKYIDGRLCYGIYNDAVVIFEDVSYALAVIGGYKISEYSFYNHKPFKIFVYKNNVKYNLVDDYETIINNSVLNQENIKNIYYMHQLWQKFANYIKSNSSFDFSYEFVNETNAVAKNFRSELHQYLKSKNCSKQVISNLAFIYARIEICVSMIDNALSETQIEALENYAKEMIENLIIDNILVDEINSNYREKFNENIYAWYCYNDKNGNIYLFVPSNEGTEMYLEFEKDTYNESIFYYPTEFKIFAYNNNEFDLIDENDLNTYYIRTIYSHYILFMSFKSLA